MPASHASLHYIVAATPRSGSTLVCELLKGSGVAGRPAEDFQTLPTTSIYRQPRQYFDGVDAPFVDRLTQTDAGRPETAEEFAALLQRSFDEATTPNGVYGTKVMWGYLDHLAARLTSLPGLAGASLEEALAATFPNLRFVQIQRRDKVAQAVSLWTAVQTQTWRDEGEGRGAEPEVFYDFDAIHHLVELQTAHESAWSDWLGRQDLPVRTVVYEELAADPRAGVRAVIDWLDVPGGREAVVPEPRMRKQRGGRSEEWAARYREERDANAAASGDRAGV